VRADDGARRAARLAVAPAAAGVGAWQAGRRVRQWAGQAAAGAAPVDGTAHWRQISLK
jgi:hypothetical protein